MSAGIIIRSARNFDGASIGLAPQVSDFQENNFAARVLRFADDHLAGARNILVVPARSRACAGIVSHSMLERWYNRIHVIPERTDFGNLVSEQTVIIEVWNGYFAVRHLSSIDEVNLDGATLLGTRTHDFQPLESYLYYLTVSLAGAPTFDGFYRWNFDTERPTSRVTGRRVLAMPFKHNWSENIVENLTWLTDVLVGFSGREQRMSLRDTPRRRLDYSYLLGSQSERTIFHALLNGWRNRIFAVPVWTDSTRLVADVAAGSVTIPFASGDLAGRDYDAGFLVILYQDHLNYEIVEIASVNATSLTTKTALERSWSQGISVAPCRLAVLNPSVSFNDLTTSMAEAKLSWQVKSDQVSTNRVGVSNPAQYKGLDVFISPHDYSEDRQITNVGRQETFDFGGVFFIDSQNQIAQNTNTHRLVFTTRAEISEFLGWLDRRKGRFAPFYFAPLTNDFVLARTAAPTDTVLKVEACGYTQLLSGNPTRSDICIRLPSGAYAFRAITGASQNADGTENISIDASLGETLAAGSSFCFLIKSRLGGDGVEISWDTDGVATVTLQFTEIYELPST